jgi:uncharacterized RDD family membrane protein YckC
MSNQFIVDTPENVSFAFDVAGIGSRFLAVLIDTLIQATLYVFLFVVLVLIEYAGALNSLPVELANLLPVLLLAVLFLIQFGYFLLFELFTGGQTPGKQLFGLRVIKENGYPLSPLDSLIRNLVRVIDFFPLAYGVGVIVMFLNDRSRRLGDFAAGTLVVKQRDEVKLAALRALRAPLAASHGAPDWPGDLPGIENLREPDIELVESFLQRRAQLRNAAALAGTLARTIRARLDMRETGSQAPAISDEDFLRQVLAAYRRTHQHV